MHRLVKNAIASLLLLIGLLFLLINAVILARGAARWGLEWSEKIGYATVAACVPFVLGAMPILIVATWKGGKRFGRPTTWTLVTIVMWCAFIAYNFVNATGAISLVRSDVVATRQHDSRTESAKVRERDRLVAERDAAGTPRPAGAVLALVAAEKQSRDYLWSQECKAPQNQRQRHLCANIEKLQAEASASMRVAELGPKIAKLDEELAGSGPVAAIADPQVEFLHTWTGIDKDKLGYSLAASTPIILELGSLFLTAMGLLLMGWAHTMPVEAEAKPGKPKQVGPAETTEKREVTSLTRQTDLARWFFAHCTVPVRGGSLTETEWYAHYRSICKRSNDTPLGVESFRRMAEGFGIRVIEIDGQSHYKEFLPKIPNASVA